MGNEGEMGDMGVRGFHTYCYRVSGGKLGGNGERNMGVVGLTNISCGMGIGRA